MIIGLLVLKEKIFEGFCHIWASRPYWSFDLNNYTNFLYLHGGGSGLRLNDGFDVKLEIVG